jgi:hypothetical protein
MDTQVQRFFFFARPAKDHPKHFEWQTAHLCIFVAENNKQRALELAKQQAVNERWVIIRVNHKSTLIEERVREAGGEVWKGYQQAKEQGIFFRAFFQSMIVDDKDEPMLALMPRLTESFMDTVVERAGGHRLTAEETNFEQSRNADYLLDDCVFELKILEDEGLDVATRQQKLAELFCQPLPPDSTILLDPSTLSETDRRKYMDVVGGPIQNAVKSASKQIRSTKEHLGRADMRGGVIFLNTGYGTLPPDIFASLVGRYATKDTSQINVTVAISTWMQTAAIGGTVMFEFNPHEPADAVARKLRDAFWERVDEWMTEYARGGFRHEGEMISPLKPIAFELGGIIFATGPLSQTDIIDS